MDKLNELDLKDLDLGDVGNLTDISGIEGIGDSLLDSIEDDLLDITSILEEDEYQEDIFDGKYYISYLGLNPLTLLKEEDETVRLVIYTNYHKDKLLFLIEDVQNFIRGIKYLEVKYRKEYSDKKGKILDDELYDLKERLNEITKILKIMNSKLDILKGIADVLSYDISAILPKRKEPIAVVDIVRDSSIQGSIIDYVLTNIEGNVKNEHKAKDKEVRIENLRRLMNSIETLIRTQDTLNEEDTIEEKISIYQGRNYQYMDKEKELLEFLRFPTTLMGRENLIKENINQRYDSKTTSATINLNDWHKDKIYGLNNILSALDNKKKIASFYE